MALYQGKQIVATPTGITLIEGLPVASLASPELTGAGQARLARVARGQEARSAFMNDIVRYGEVVTAIRGGSRIASSRDRTNIGISAKAADTANTANTAGAANATNTASAAKTRAPAKKRR